MLDLYYKNHSFASPNNLSFRGCCFKTLYLSSNQLTQKLKLLGKDYMNGFILFQTRPLTQEPIWAWSVDNAQAHVPCAKIPLLIIKWGGARIDL